MQDVITSIDPNDNARCRHQYTVAPNGIICHRVLPAQSNVWANDAPIEPWWEPVLQVPESQLGRRIIPLLRQCADIYNLKPDDSESIIRLRYRIYAYPQVRAVVAYTPDWREVRYAKYGGGVALQPPNEDRWVCFPDLQAARIWWAAKAGIPCIRDVPFSSAQDVSAISLRLAPIDVGFSLVGEQISVAVPRCDYLRVSYATRQGVRRVAEGSRGLVVDLLRKNGYLIVDAEEEEEDSGYSNMGGVDDDSGGFNREGYREADHGRTPQPGG
jgi:hypothetical protein